MDNKKIDTIKDWIYIAGVLVMLVMAFLPLVDINEDWMRWAYAGGAAVTLIVRLTQRYTGKNFRIRRLYIMSTMAAVLYCVSAALTFYGKGTSDWIALLMAGAVLQMYSSFMIDRELAKEAAKKEAKKEARKNRK